MFLVSLFNTHTVNKIVAKIKRRLQCHFQLQKYTYMYVKLVDLKLKPEYIHVNSMLEL